MTQKLSSISISSQLGIPSAPPPSGLSLLFAAIDIVLKD